jgi:hypothetical protein
MGEYASSEVEVCNISEERRSSASVFRVEELAKKVSCRLFFEPKDGELYSETSVNLCRIIWHHIPEDSTIHSDRGGNLIISTNYFVWDM